MTLRLSPTNPRPRPAAGVEGDGSPLTFYEQIRLDEVMLRLKLR